MTLTHQENSPDIDKGYAFVVGTCGFFVVMFTYGLSYTNSIFYAIFLDEFQESPVTTAWAFNLNLFCFVATAVFANGLLIMTGPRLTLVAACLMSVTGLTASSFVNSPMGVLGTYGLLTGSGFGFTYFTTFSIIPKYFWKYRIIANAVISTGVGVGQFVNPPLLDFLIEKYHWRGAFIVLGGINLNILILAAAIIPPRRFTAALESKPSTGTGLRVKSRQAFSALKTTLSGISIFKNSLWILYCVGIILITLALGGFLTHIYNFARSPRFGFSSTQKTFLPSIVGIGSISGRLIIGAITQIPKVHPVMMFMISFGFLTTGSITITLVDGYPPFVFCCIASGISLGGWAIFFEVIVHIVGLDTFSTGLSYSMLIAGLGYLAGGPFAAWIYEQEPSYLWSFRALGISAFFGVVSNFASWLTIKDGKIQQRKSKDELKKEISIPAGKVDVHAQDCISHL